MAQVTLKDYFPSVKKKEDGIKDVSRKRSLESYTVPRGKKRKVSATLAVQKDKPNAPSTSSTKSKKAKSQSRLTASSTLAPSTSKVVNEVTEGAVIETTKTFASTCATPRGAKSSPSSSPLSRGAACLKLALNKDKTSSPSRSPLISGREQVTSFKEARRNLFAEPKSSTSSNLTVKDEALPQHPVYTSSVPSPMKKNQQSTPDKSAPKLSHFKALQYDSPTKKKKQLPSYEKYKFIAEPTIDLPLPKHYGLLAEKFHCTDTVVNMLQKRGETCTYLKLKDAVQQMNRRLFEKCDLAQMKSVYPSALSFDQQRHIPGMYGYDCYNRYQLTVKCNTEETGDSGVTDETEDQERPRVSTRPPHLSSSVLLKRRQKFKRNLVGVVKQHHKEFLAGLDPPVTIPNDKIDRWHPSFPLEHVADIKPSSLPHPPDTPSCSSARDLLNIASSSMTPRVQQALENVADSKATAPVQPPEPAALNPAVEKALKGLPQSIIDKIKAKEADRAKAAMTRDHATEKKLGMLSALPEMCRVIRTLFVAEKKAAIPVEQVVQKLIDSSGYSADNIEGHLTLIEEVLPEWFKMVTVRKSSYVKVDRKMEIKKILDRIEQKSNELSK